MPTLGSHTSPELDGRARSLLVVPLGSTEQHGPHLPLDTDTVLAVAWAEATAEALWAQGCAALVAPVLPYGSAGEHQHFAGTLSIGGPALHQLLVELIRSAAHHHDGVLLLSGHAGNAEVLDAVRAQMSDEGHRIAVAVPILPGADAHAGRTETALMLHVAPSSVRLDRLVAGNTTPVGELLPHLRAGGVVSVSPNGVLGDPSGASAQEGADLFRALVDLGVRQASLLR